MAKKKVKKPKEEFLSIGVKVTGYNASVDASINYEARDLKRRESERTYISSNCICTIMIFDINTYSGG